MTNFVGGGMEPVDRYSCNAARVEVARMPGGVVRLGFAGPITISAMKSLGVMAAKATEGASGLLFLLDRAILLFDDLEPMHRPTSDHQRISGAMVVQVQDLPMFDRYSRASATRGITRAVFLADELPQALRWLAAESLGGRQRSPPSQPDTRPVSPVASSAYRRSERRGA